MGEVAANEKPLDWISDMLLSATVEAKHITAGAGDDGEGEREGEGGNHRTPLSHLSSLSIKSNDSARVLLLTRIIHKCARALA